MKPHWTAIMVMATFASGCAFTEQAVVISPRIDVAASPMGADHAVNLNVVDERPRQTLGTRGVRGVGAELKVEGDLSDIVRKALDEGLTKLNFKPLVGSNPEGRESACRDSKPRLHSHPGILGWHAPSGYQLESNLHSRSPAPI